MKYRNSKKEFISSILIILLTLLISCAVFLRLNHIGQPLMFLYILFVDALILYFSFFTMIKGFSEARKKFFSLKSAAVILILISVLISFKTFTGNVTKNMGPVSWTENFTTSIRPSLRSVLCAILLFSSVFIRYGTKEIKGAASYVLLTLDILFVSSFLNILCNNEAWPIPFLNIDNQTFLILAIIFSWVGISAVSGFVWAFIFLMGILRMVKLENVMGFSAVVYLLCAFISLIMQLKVFNLHFRFAKEFFNPVSDRIKNDVKASTSLAANAVTGGLSGTMQAISSSAAQKLPVTNADINSESEKLPATNSILKSEQEKSSEKESILKAEPEELNQNHEAEIKKAPEYFSTKTETSEAFPEKEINDLLS